MQLLVGYLVDLVCGRQRFRSFFVVVVFSLLFVLLHDLVHAAPKTTFSLTLLRRVRMLTLWGRDGHGGRTDGGGIIAESPENGQLAK
jgi:hypothetical protein